MGLIIMTLTCFTSKSTKYRAVGLLSFCNFFEKYGGTFDFQVPSTGTLTEYRYRRNFKKIPCPPLPLGHVSYHILAQFIGIFGTIFLQLRLGLLQKYMHG